MNSTLSAPCISVEDQQKSFINWFRNSSPYIHAHRGCTFVISFGGEAVLDDSFADLIHDFALLNSLGIRLVLVHGIRPQIDERLNKQNIRSEFHGHLRITDDAALKCVKEAAGMVRVEIESLLSMGLPNSPMSGADIRVSSGNLIKARPMGVIDGIDHCHTGQVRRIDQEGIRQQLDQNHVVLISPIGYSPSGETFNLCAEKVATEVAIALQAEKLVLLTEKSCGFSVLTSDEAEDYLAKNPTLSVEHRNPLEAAIHGCRSGVKRVHLIDRTYDGALLLELFSRKGLGTLISSNPFEELRPAVLKDIGGILELIKPLEDRGQLIKRSRESLEMKISDYFVIEIDGLIVGCAALHLLPEESKGEIACIAIHPEYRHAERGSLLLECLMEKAKQLNIRQLFLLSTQTMHWFLERGFQTIPDSQLPDSLKTLYNARRNSKVLYKTFT